MYLQLMLSSFYNDAKQTADYGRGFVMMDITVRSDFLKEKVHPAISFSLKVHKTRGLQFYTFFGISIGIKLNGNQTENGRYWQKNNF
jgi:hypothetical protein